MKIKITTEAGTEKWVDAETLPANVRRAAKLPSRARQRRQISEFMDSRREYNRILAVEESMLKRAMGE